MDIAKSPDATGTDEPLFLKIFRAIDAAGDAGLPPSEFPALPHPQEFSWSTFVDLGFLVPVVDGNARRYHLTRAGEKCLRILTPWVYKPSGGSASAEVQPVFAPGDNSTRAWVAANGI